MAQHAQDSLEKKAASVYVQDKESPPIPIYTTIFVYLLKIYGYTEYSTYHTHINRNGPKNAHSGKCG